MKTTIYEVASRAGVSTATVSHVCNNTRYVSKEVREKVINAINELHTVKKESSRIPPQKVIWDIEDLSQQPPWGNDISEDITDLSNYFVTSEGDDLFDILFEAFGVAKDDNENIEIKQL